MSEPDLGVALTNCFYCGEGDRIILNTRLTKRMADGVREMHGKVIDYEPCRKCADLMKEGVILLGVDEEKTTDMEAPYRSGHFVVVRDQWVERTIEPPELKAKILKCRWSLVDHRVLAQMVEENEALEKETPDA